MYVDPFSVPFVDGESIARFPAQLIFEMWIIIVSILYFLAYTCFERNHLPLILIADSWQD